MNQTRLFFPLIFISLEDDSDIIIPPQPTGPGEIMSGGEGEPVEADVPAEDETVTPQGMHVTGTQTVTHEYLTLNGKVARETIRTNNTLTAILDFIYDNSGKPFALRYSTDGTSFETYYYVLNLQGDVVKLIQANGHVVAQYTYDAWGNILDSGGNLAEVNPLRYRGYYYDNETGFYYLQSRYYDPANRRFINADTYSSTDSSDAVSCNMFAYCGNNPVTRSDETGEFWNLVIGAVVGAVVNAVTTVVSAKMNGEEVDWVDVAISAAVGAASGAVAATGIGALGQAGITAVISGGGNLVQQLADNARSGESGIDVMDIVYSGAAGFATSIVGSAAGKIASGKIATAGENLLAKGQSNMMTGYVRQHVGKSASSLLRHGAKMVAQGTKTINIARGISSVVGTLSTWRYNVLFNEII